MDCLPATIMSVLMGAGVLFVAHLPLGLGTIALLFVEILVGMVIYVLLSVITHNEEFMALAAMAKQYLKR